VVDERLDVDVKALGWRHDPSRIFTKIVKGDGDGTQSNGSLADVGEKTFR